MHIPEVDPILSDNGVTVKADLGKRVVAFLIDCVLAGLAGVLVGMLVPSLGGVAGAAYFLVRDGLELKYMDRRSFGKHVMNLQCVRHDGMAMDLETSMRRNWMLALSGLATLTIFGPFRWLLSLAGTVFLIYEVYRVLTRSDGRRWGDDMAGTQVVE